MCFELRFFFTRLIRTSATTTLAFHGISNQFKNSLARCNFFLVSFLSLCALIFHICAFLSNCTSNNTASSTSAKLIGVPLLIFQFFIVINAIAICIFCIFIWSTLLHSRRRVCVFFFSLLTTSTSANSCFVQKMLQLSAIRCDI